jgi:hypothetical protein
LQVYQDEGNLIQKERKTMKHDRSTISNVAAPALILFGLSIAAVPGAFAKHRAVKPAEQPTSVIAHLALPGAPASQVFLQERGEKQYLIIGQRSAAGFTVVDVTKPNQPNMLKGGSWPNESSTGKLQMIGGGLALAAAPDGDAMPMESAPRTETVRLIDWSDPVNPRTIQTFSGVTSTLTDDGRGLVFLTNSDGLWIVKHQPEQAVFSSPRGCTTADAFNEFANCQ